MTVLRTTRYQTGTSTVEEVLTRRNDLVAAIRAAYPGLDEARLTRAGDGTWVDLWRWESAELMEAAVAGAPKLPESARAFALTSDVTVEVTEVVDER
ncbi:hypothetical protein [Actinomadura harenae]|uniref:ABM domain-containing protein n=1 Tax=Actinomadura harenae TaxID=2483351 RepID=A0A3M2LW40_9ACTN|nr:hypothetical protein [Actinomadura harenae]RMI41597.1 hypothetical protein EBO15_22630 [Actinomadura harenae]